MSIRTEDLFHMQYLIQEKKSNYFRKYLRPQNLDHSGHHKRSSNSHKNADRRRNRPNSTIPRPAFPPAFRRAIWPRNLRRASYALMEISKQRGHGVCRDKEWMTERIVLRAAGSEAGRPGTEFTAAPDLMMLQGAPRTGIAAKTRPRPAAGPASFPVDRSLYFYRHIGIPWSLQAKINSIRFLTRFFMCVRKSFRVFFWGNVIFADLNPE